MAYRRQPAPRTGRDVEQHSAGRRRADGRSPARPRDRSALARRHRLTRHHRSAAGPAVVLRRYASVSPGYASAARAARAAIPAHCRVPAGGPGSRTGELRAAGPRPRLRRNRRLRPSRLEPLAVGLPGRISPGPSGAARLRRPPPPAPRRSNAPVGRRDRGRRPAALRRHRDGRRRWSTRTVADKAQEAVTPLTDPVAVHGGPRPAHRDARPAGPPAPTTGLGGQTIKVTYEVDRRRPRRDPLRRRARRRPEAARQRVAAVEAHHQRCRPRPWSRSTAMRLGTTDGTDQLPRAGRRRGGQEVHLRRRQRRDGLLHVLRPRLNLDQRATTSRKGPRRP